MVQPLVVAGLVALSATSAAAVGPPGPPPWLCSGDAACDGDDCTWLVPLLAPFEMHEARPGDFVVIAGDVTRQRLARVFPAMEEARSAVAGSGAVAFDHVLTPSDHVADAHGFRLTPVRTFGDGRSEIGEDAMLISCTSLVRR